MSKHWGVKSISKNLLRGGYDVQFENTGSKVVIEAYIPEVGLFEADPTKPWVPNMTEPKKDKVLKKMKKGIDDGTP